MPLLRSLKILARYGYKDSAPTALDATRLILGVKLRSQWLLDKTLTPLSRKICNTRSKFTSFGTATC